MEVLPEDFNGVGDVVKKMARRRSFTKLAAEVPAPREGGDYGGVLAKAKNITTRKWLIATSTSLLLALTIAFAYWRLIHDQSQGLHLGGEQQSETAVEHNNFRLHPKQHATRPPTTQVYNWTITTGDRRPDGVLKQVYLVNDDFPGPLIEARSGDRLIIDVYNGLPENEGLSLHWHGLSMRGYNNHDGAVGMTQQPVPAGERHIYDFTADSDQAGTFWWHAHSAVQRADGLFGGLVVHEPSSSKVSALRQDEADEYLLMVQDWYHRSAQEALDFYMHPGSFGNEPVPDSVLLNGAGTFNCWNAVPARPLDCRTRNFETLPTLELDHSKRNLVRVVNVGAYAGTYISVPGSQLTAVAVDGGHAVDGSPAMSAGPLHPGERVDLIIEPIVDSDNDQSLHISLDSSTFKYGNAALTTKHSFPVRWHGRARRQSSSMTSFSSSIDLQGLKAARPSTNGPCAVADQTMVLYAITQKLARLENIPHGFINGSSWQPQSSPSKPLTELVREQWDQHQFVPHIKHRPEAPLCLDIVLNNLDEEGHPFHLHGYDFWVLGTHSSTYNWGSYNPFEMADLPGGPLDLIRPAKKDTVLVPRRGYAVIRLLADNRECSFILVLNS